MITIMKFMADYFADNGDEDGLRDKVFQNEEVGLARLQLSANAQATLPQLVEKDIFGLVEAELRDEMGLQPGELDLTGVIDALKQITLDNGCDLKEARRIIRENGYDCKSGKVVTSLALGAGYGAGQVHIRKITVKSGRLKVGEEVQVIVAGQGFPPGVQGGFSKLHEGNPTVPAVTSDRHADTDVHQYVTLTATFDVHGDYFTGLTHADGGWRYSECVLRIEP